MATAQAQAYYEPGMAFIPVVEGKLVGEAGAAPSDNAGESKIPQAPAGGAPSGLKYIAISQGQSATYLVRIILFASSILLRSLLLLLLLPRLLPPLVRLLLLPFLPFECHALTNPPTPCTHPHLHSTTPTHSRTLAGALGRADRSHHGRREGHFSARLR